MKDDKFLKGISSTGFGLEFSISQSLTSDGWTVINNKYYIDDVQGSAREIDILAYKVTTKNKIQVYTVLIISCKKSNENTWALLAKDKGIKDPNIDWSPVTLWSNQKAIKMVIENYKWKDKYVKTSSYLSRELFVPDKHIFAFQELNSNKGTPQNDKAIFNSIVTSMKSQDYEISSLDKRKKEEAVYNFNLVSVVDAPLKRINYGKEIPEIEDIDSDIYVGSYIINKKETVSRVHLINSNAFNSTLAIYNELHIHNIEQSSVILESYYVDCLKDKRKSSLYKEEFSRKLRWEVYKVLQDLRSPTKVELNNVTAGWDKKKDCATIEVESVWDEKETNALNTNNKIKVIVAKALKDIYHYEGDFYFDDEIPF